MRQIVVVIGAFMLALAASACNLAMQTEIEATLPVVSSDQPNDDSPKNAGGAGGQAATCFYSAAGIAAPHPVYSQPDGTSAQVGTADINHPFPVLAQSEVFYEIILPDGQIGWLRQLTGGLSGDCATLPMQKARPATPEGVCSFYTDAPGVQLYGTADGQQALGKIPPNAYFPVEARASIGSVRLRLDDGTTGWVVWPDTVLTEMQALSGPCDVLPVESLPTGD